MRAAVLEGPRSLVVTDVAEPTCQPGEVLVEVDLAGVCGSDLALFEGRRPAVYPLILGHEAVGRLVHDGTRVVIEPNMPCGACSVCTRGHGNVCPRKRSLGLNAPGVFAERVAVPAEFVHRLPPHLDPLDAVGLEPLAVAVHGLRVGNVQERDRVAVIGCGNQGLLLIQLAVAKGARVLAADVRREPLSVARALGALNTLYLGADAPADAADWSPGVVFEAAGSASAVEAAMQMVAPGGSVVMVGLTDQPVSVVPLRFVRRGLRLIGSLIYDHPRDFQCAIDLVEQGLVHPRLHVSSIAELSQASAALPRIVRGEAGKTVFDVGGVLERPTAPARESSTCDAR
jgi:2-desacetyl-2-hydroxyethyl bacteriochlorophyllide A dehydrogenase